MAEHWLGMRRHLILLSTVVVIVLALQSASVGLHVAVAGINGEIDGGCTTLQRCYLKALTKASSASFWGSLPQSQSSIRHREPDSFSYGGSVHDLLMLQESAVSHIFNNILSSVLTLIQVSMLIFGACVSMALVAQEKAERNPTSPWHKLVTVGVIIGAAIVLFNGWHILTVPLFAILSGLANWAFPYTFYMTEVQRDPVDVAAEPARLSASTKKRLLASAVTCFVLLLVRRVLCGGLHYQDHEDDDRIEWQKNAFGLKLVDSERSYANFQVLSIAQELSLTRSNMQNTWDCAAIFISHANAAAAFVWMNLFDARSTTFLCTLLDTAILLVSMGWMAQLACISMITVAQRRPQNHSYRTRLFLFGIGWGMLFALLDGWRMMATILFGVLVGILNINLPYIHYVTEITRYTDWAYRV